MSQQTRPKSLWEVRAEKAEASCETLRQDVAYWRDAEQAASWASDNLAVERDTLRAQLRGLREALEQIVSSARYGFRGTPYRDALDAAKRMLGYACDECGALYVSSDASASGDKLHDHAVKGCTGKHRESLAATPEAAPTEAK